jgi:hypothetical protein
VALLLVACGTGTETTGGSISPTSTGPAITTSTTLQPGALATTTQGPATTSGRSTIPTTTTQSLADTNITGALVPQHSGSYRFTPTEMNGTSYANALKIYSERGPADVEINAGRSRKLFRGSLGIPDDESSSSSHQVEISFDGAPPAFSAVVNFGETKNVDLDVTGVLRVKITVSSITNSSGYVAIGNPRFS